MDNQNFVDYVKILFRSGKGGAGSMHFHRSKLTAKGGPDGGDGGRGGHIILKGNSHMWTLLHMKYQKHVFAGDGQSGAAALKTGKQGEDRIIEVPIGTIARDPETGEVFGEVMADGEELVLLQGGRGGLGNNHFKTAVNQAPRYSQPGEEGTEAWIVLELKVLADVGLVGFPNAGKSTLLSVLSAAKPEIADYPFTTLTPKLGIVSYRDNRSFVMADIPGIIEGASEGRGLGTRFLRHIERNSALLFMVPAEAKDIHQEYRILLHELKQHNPELMTKSRMLAITKSDLIDDELEMMLSKDLPDVPVVFISSHTGKNMDKLKDMLWNILVND
ncbi:MAG: GTPase ObgE [Chitinophagales bacterium]|nr:GTPase ObgE [Chitinophagales bacterium]HAE12798.1 GTPase ObgE [Bacteroidota bacterium]MCB9019597.1 GTPase ObgE [Chitinophagales bacterium]MCB9022799.1 GTPase ObgE [Chitinophagales bacterium]HAE34184.1 GTPase ObgE [Bacteroidota bacterium]